jgi:hypothetical protein
MSGCPFSTRTAEYYDQAEEAFEAGEVPVGCVFVRDGNIIAKARNRTNELCNVRSLCRVNVPTHSFLGDETCRIRSNRRNIVGFRAHSEWLPIEHDYPICHSRAMHHVCIGSSPVGNKRGFLWLCQRQIRRLWKCPWRK